MQENRDTYCGFVAIVGRPNVGKSTLLNHLVGSKISITADKPQTTRHQIIGVSTKDNCQALFIDTPGMHLKQKKAINRAMNNAAKSSLADVDAVIFVIEALHWTSEDELVLDTIKNLTCPVLLVVNKIDMLKDKAELLPFLEEISKKREFTEIIPCVAINGEQINIIEDKIFSLLPSGPMLYPDDQITDKPLRFRLAEIIREKLTRLLAAELPYALSVEIEDIRNTDTQLVVHAIIWVERASQKTIVIGKNGAVLKEIGREARLEMNHILKTSVHLELWVKVKDNWSNNKHDLQNLGYLNDE